MWCDDMIYDMIYDLWYMIYDVMWCDMTWHDMAWHDMMYGMVWYDMIWYGMVYVHVYINSLFCFVYTLVMILLMNQYILHAEQCVTCRIY